jgi:hypothetical protein
MIWGEKSLPATRQGKAKQSSVPRQSKQRSQKKQRENRSTAPTDLYIE